MNVDFISGFIAKKKKKKKKILFSGCSVQHDIIDVHVNIFEKSENMTIAKALPTWVLVAQDKTPLVYIGNIITHDYYIQSEFCIFPDISPPRIAF